MIIAAERHDGMRIVERYDTAGLPYFVPVHPVFGSLESSGNLEAAMERADLVWPADTEDTSANDAEQHLRQEQRRADRFAYQPVVVRRRAR